MAVGKRSAGTPNIVRRADGGANWADQSGVTAQNLKGLAGVNSFAIAVGKSASLLVSEDLGASWTLQSSASAADLEAADAINPVVAVGAGGEILLSNDQATGAAGYCLLRMERAVFRVIPECTGIFTLLILQAAVDAGLQAQGLPLVLGGPGLVLLVWLQALPERFWLAQRPAAVRPPRMAYIPGTGNGGPPRAAATTTKERSG